MKKCKEFLVTQVYFIMSSVPLQSTNYSYEKQLLALLHEKSKEGKFNDSELEKHLSKVWEKAKNATIEQQINLCLEAQEKLKSSVEQLKQFIEGEISSVNWQSEIRLLIDNLEIVLKMAKHYRKRCKKPNMLQKTGQFFSTILLRKLGENEEKLWKDPIYSLDYIRRYFKYTSQGAYSTQIKQIHHKRVLSYLNLSLSLSDELALWLKGEIKHESKKIHPQYFQQ